MNNTNVIVSVNTMNDISNINNNTKYINLSIDSFFTFSKISLSG